MQKTKVSIGKGPGCSWKIWFKSLKETNPSWRLKPVAFRSELNTPIDQHPRLTPPSEYDRYHRPFQIRVPPGFSSGLLLITLCLERSCDAWKRLAFVKRQLYSFRVTDAYTSLGKARNGFETPHLKRIKLWCNCPFLLSQVCCGNKVFSNAKFCCGRVGYNPMTQTCCGGRVLTPHGGPFHGLSRCCGGSLYNPSFQDCCHGRYTRPKGCCYIRHQKGSQYSNRFCSELQ